METKDRSGQIGACDAKRLDHRCQSGWTRIRQTVLSDGWQVYAACRDPNSASELRRLRAPTICDRWPAPEPSAVC
jgi:hypothetical protein